jgi:hypothetical protein
MTCLRLSYKKNEIIKKNLASLKSLKKGVASGVGSGSISQRYGSRDPDPDLNQNVTDPQHWFPSACTERCLIALSACTAVPTLPTPKAFVIPCIGAVR